jgi:Protein of unknown function DUF262.
MEVRLLQENEMTRYFNDASVQQYKSDIGFRTLVESVNDNLYVIPKYQRKYRWGRQQVVGLVESLLRGLPIPPIYTCRNDKNQLEILDGQQRVMSLFFYYIGYFLNKKKESAINFSELEVGDFSFADALKEQYPLEELHIEINGMNVDYNDLPVELKRKVDYISITVIEIKIEQKKKKDEILQTIFANLNKNGAILSKQEQRNGIYMCDFYDMLQEFNKRNVKWRKLWGREDSKDRDLQTLLRFCALRKYVCYVKELKESRIDFKINGYYSSYAEMLDAFSKEAMSFGDGDIVKYQKSLEEFVGLFEINTVLSSKVALMEGFYIIYEKLGVKKGITKPLLDKVQNENGYKENSGQRTVNIKKMNGRWNTVYAVWDGFTQ